MTGLARRVCAAVGGASLAVLAVAPGAGWAAGEKKTPSEGSTATLASPFVLAVDNAGAAVGLPSGTRLYASLVPTVTWLRRDDRNGKVDSGPLLLEAAVPYLRMKTPGIFSSNNAQVPLSALRSLRYDGARRQWSVETAEGTRTFDWMNPAACPPGAAPTAADQCLMAVDVRYRVRGGDIGRRLVVDKELSMDALSGAGAVFGPAPAGWEQALADTWAGVKAAVAKDEADRQAAADQRAQQEQQERERAWARLDAQPRGAQLFCSSGGGAFAATADRGIETLSYRCGELVNVGLPGLLARGWQVTSQSMVPVPTYGGTGYDAHLVLTKR